MLAVPLHGDDVAPRFCSADRFLIAEVDGDQAHRIRRLTLSEVTWSQCLERLSAAGVRVLLCGGFNRSFLPLAESLGIRVISGLAGEAEQLRQFHQALQPPAIDIRNIRGVQNHAPEILLQRLRGSGAELLGIVARQGPVRAEDFHRPVLLLD